MNLLPWYVWVGLGIVVVTWLILWASERREYRKKIAGLLHNDPSRNETALLELLLQLKPGTFEDYWFIRGDERLCLSFVERNEDVLTASKEDGIWNLSVLRRMDMVHFIGVLKRKYQ